MTRQPHFSALLNQQFNHKKILILGWGREGQSTYTLLHQVCPAAQFFISDQNQQRIQQWQQETAADVQILPYLQQLEIVDVIFKTPGIPIRLPALQTALAQGKQITTQLNEFLHVFRDQVIGISGTKGKSTTSSLITHLLNGAGADVLLAGNIGTPVFDIAHQITSQTQIVLEMSSYQLETATTSPQTAILLNFFSEHLNYHLTKENYLAAKSHITRFQKKSDVLIYNADSAELGGIAAQTAAQLVPFSYQNQLGYPPLVNQVLARVDQINLPAPVKRKNVLPALLATHQYFQTADQIITQLSTFKTLEHRLEVVGTFNGIQWIDDTLATIPEATIAALETLPRVDVLLLGGYDRGIAFDQIIEACISHHIPAIGFFKPSGQKMYQLLKSHYPPEKWPQMKIVENMEEAVAFGYAHAPVGGTVLLSPSSPSFGQFLDYRDKSAQFRDWIQKLATV